jgi:CRP-like cAMP-binding protein
MVQTDKPKTDAIHAAFSEGKAIPYDRGRVLLHANEEPNYIYYINEGFVRVYTLNSRAEQFTHTVYNRGEIFPLFWVIDSPKRDVYFEALTDCSVFILPRSELQAKLKSNAELSYQMIRQAINQYRLYTDRVENLEHKFASERLAYSLLFLASRFGEKRGNEIVIKAPLTHHVLGSTINLSRESISRELDKLVQKGLIGYEGRLFVVKDFAALARQFKKPVSPNWWGMIDNESQ